jgi:hypothetical protein
VFGFVQSMPFNERFADTILINNAPISSSAVTSSGFYNFVQLDVPTYFNYLQPKNCKPRDEL